LLPMTVLLHPSPHLEGHPVSVFLRHHRHSPHLESPLVYRWNILGRPLGRRECPLACPSTTVRWVAFYCERLFETSGVVSIRAWSYQATWPSKWGEGRGGFIKIVPIHQRIIHRLGTPLPVPPQRTARWLRPRRSGGRHPASLLPSPASAPVAQVTTSDQTVPTAYLL